MVSYKNLRKLIGILGILLPFMCVIGGLISNSVIENSISDYYYTNMRDIFVGILFITGSFLITYRSYQTIDTVVNSISGICAILIALFPDYISSEEYVGVFQLSPDTSNIVHSISAVLFFLTLYINSTFLFTLSNDHPTEQKLKRNIIYKVCGYIILLNVALIIIFHKFDYIILISETISLLAFGIAWLVKGGTILLDK